MSAVGDSRYQDVLVNAAGRKGLGPAEAFSHWVAGIVFAAAGSLARQRRRRQTLNQLGGLDDRLLRDIGIDPADIPARASAGELRHIADLLTPPRR